MTTGTTELTGSDYVLTALEAEGIGRLFGLIGEGNAHLIDRTNDHAVEFTYARHEQVAATMADGHARVTGGVSACTLTHGPGVTNAATGIAAADRDNVPLVVLIGDTDVKGRETALQYLDHATFTEPIVAYHTRVETPAVLPEALRRAFGKARTERGPAVVELPGEIQRGPAPDPDTYTPKPTAEGRIRPDRGALDRAARLLDRAERPAILIGGGAREAGAAEAVTTLADRIGAPIAATYFAKGLLAPEHPLYAGIAGTFMSPANDALLWETDVLLAVGAQLSGKTTRYGELFADAEVIQIDIDPDAIGRHRDPAIGLLGDAAAAVEGLSRRVDPAPDRAERVSETIEDAGLKAPYEDTTGGGSVDPRALTETVAARTPDGAVVAVDSGNNTGFPAVFHPIGPPGRMLVNGNFGTMGYALPAALGAKVAAPDRPVLAYVGDGSLLQVLQAIETGVRLGLGVAVIVMNDAGYGIIRHRQDEEFDRVTGAEYERPDFAAVAEGLGAHGVTVTQLEECVVIEEYLEGDPDVPLVLDVRTDPGVTRPGFPPY